MNETTKYFVQTFVQGCPAEINFENNPFFSRSLEKKNFCIKLLKAALKIFIKRKWVFYLCIYIIFSRHLAFSGRELLNKALSGIGVYLFRLTFVLRFFSLWSQACFTLAPEQKHENTRFIKGRYMA